MKTEILRKYIRELIENATGLQVAFFHANDEMKCPYLVFDIKELIADYSGRHNMELIVDAWDKDSNKEIEEAIDKLDRILDEYKDNTNAFVLCIYHGSSKQYIEDTDKTIQRLQRRYDMIIWEKER